MFDENVDGVNVGVGNKRKLQDVGAHRAQSTQKTSDTAMNHFNRFLDYINYPVTDYCNLTAESITTELFGWFADYLINEVKLGKSGSAKDYISSVRVRLQNLHKNVTLEINDENWYKKYRSNTDKMYMEKEQYMDEAGENDYVPGSKKGISMPEGHHAHIGYTLFMKKDRAAMSDRCLLALNWPCIGRISEVAQLTWNNISMKTTKYKRCMKVNLKRMKVGQKQEVQVFLHHHNWAICPMHSIATMVALNQSPATRLFPHIVNATKYVNRVLEALYDLWVEGGGLEVNGGVPLGEDDNSPFMLYTSHAQRHGSAESGNDHPEIQTQWLIPRGAWTLDQIQSLFNYIAGTAKSDAYVGRVLAGWPSTTGGGVCPGIPL